jgi:putative OPT family oligopeptide transporter
MTEALVPVEETAALARPTRGELTVRALLAGVIVAAIMGASYPYMVLKLGFGPNVSIVSAFFGFVILNLIGRSSYDRWQNNIVQTAGTSAAQTAFMCGVLASFDFLRHSAIVRFRIDPSPVQVFVWLTCASLLGVLLAAPMRRHFIVDEKLPFPDGTAAAETLIVLDPPRRLGADDPEWKSARRAAAVLGVGLAVSGLLMLVRSDVPFVKWIPDTLTTGGLTLGAAGASFVLSSMGVGASVSLLSIGSGFLISQRVNTWMLVGGVLGWLAAPLALMNAGILPDHPTRTQVLYWVLWPGVGMMLAGGMTTLVLRWRLLVEAFRALRNVEAAKEEFPLSWVVAGVAVLSVAFCIIQQQIFGLPLWMSAIAVVFSVPLMLVGLRALGETNWGPIGALSNLMQGLFALIAPGNVDANILGNGATGTIAVTSEGLIQDYKAAYLVGSTPRSMTIAQLMAAPIGAAALAWSYPALVRTYGLIGPDAQLAAPGSRRSAALAELLSAGVAKLPPSALWAMLIAVAAGALFAIAEQNPKLKRWAPSPTGLGLGVLLPFASVATIFLGGLIALVWRRVSPEQAKRFQIPLASGFIAGEAMVAVLVALVAPALPLLLAALGRH